VEGDNFVKFLGTAGARFVVAKQLRSSAGTFLRIHGKNVLIDPGPGTLVRLAKSRPKIEVTELDAIILTHMHIDHSSDVNVLIDAMTNGGLNRGGTLFTTAECLNGENAVVLKYLRGFLEDIVVLKENSEYRLGDMRFWTSFRHEHPAETYGIKFDVDGETLSFLVDTGFSPKLARGYAGSDILIINTVMLKPHNSPRIKHLSVDDVRKLVAEIKPKKVILTHFGMSMLRAKPWEVADELQDELGIDVTAASDGMKLEIRNNS
jgi:ribonuclease BN (tRNA processing enzyme)